MYDVVCRESCVVFDVVVVIVVVVAVVVIVVVVVSVVVVGAVVVGHPGPCTIIGLKKIYKISCLFGYIYDIHTFKCMFCTQCSVESHDYAPDKIVVTNFLGFECPDHPTCMTSSLLVDWLVGSDGHVATRIRRNSPGTRHAPALTYCEKHRHATAYCGSGWAIFLAKK